MIWRLTYCNKKGVEARVDIIKGDRASVEIVKGSATPFTISYKLDKNDKSGHIMTSSADIEIFETETFNIDDLKTSNETELKVEYFEDNILTWSGFILPDFFSREIGSPNIVRMTASDRLTALKGVTLSDLPIRISLRDLIELSLEQTGLDLALVAQIQINQGSTNILDSEILSQRLTDTRGRSISCYDILMSIMVATHSTIRQREGQWVVYNKLEHELRTPTIFFDKVERGAIRSIQPVASSVGVYQEFGGGRSYPDNYDFSDGLTGWTAVNGFVATIDNRKVDNFVSGTGVIPTEWTTDPVYGDVTEKNYLVNDNYGIDYDFADKPYLKSSNIPVTYPSESQINVNVLVNATGPFIDSDAYRGETNFAVIASNGTKTLHLTASGTFEPLTGDPFLHKVTFDGDTHLQAVSSSKSVNGVLSVEEGNLSGYNITVRLYGYTKGVTGGRFLVTTLVNSVIVTFKNISDAPKGNLYKTTQGSNFTKQHDIETVIFGDYITTGLNGYFYDYPIDDTSNLYLPNGELSPPTWITPFDTTERPLLHHISRQKSRLFSVAHDILRANINVESFDPLAVFQDCKGGKYVIVSASFDFLRSEVDVELEQIAYDNTISKRDFIYSYFGEGESNIKSIGGIAGGGGGTGGGGGMTSEQLEMLTNLASWWKLDEENDAIYSEKSVYSLKGVSALGLGDEGGSGGGDYDRLDKWVDYDSTKSGWVLSALLGYDLHTRAISLDTRVTDLELNSGSGSVTSVGLTVPTGLSVAGSPITEAGTFEISFAPGYSIPTTEKQGQWDIAYTNSHTHSNKSVIDALTQGHINVLNKLSLDAQGNVKVDATLWATGGVSALGLGDGGSSGGGVDMLDSWANYAPDKANYYVPASLLVPFKNDTLSRLTSLESGSATSIVTTGTGNAITSISKLGTEITANKELTFALASHTHTIAQITGLQGALDLKATQSDIDTAIDGIEIGGRNMISNGNFSRELDGWSTWSYQTTLVKTAPNVYRIQRTNIALTDAIGIQKSETDISLIEGNDYVLSFKALGYYGGVPNYVFLLHADGNYNLTSMVEDVGGTNLIVLTGSQATARQFQVKFKAPRSANNFGILIGTTGGPADSQYGIYIGEIKLEKGTKATDWTPAPEDQVSDWNETDVASLSYIKNKPTQLSQFIDNIGVGSHIANKANPHNVTTAQIGAVDLTTNQTIRGVKTFASGTASWNEEGVAMVISTHSNLYRYLEIGQLSNGVIYQQSKTDFGDFIGNISLQPQGGNVGIGTTSPSQKLHVAGNILSTSEITASTGVNTPKVIFSAAGWSLEQVGTELQIKHNGVIKQRMLSNGTILATGGLTALST